MATQRSKEEQAELDRHVLSDDPIESLKALVNHTESGVEENPEMGNTVSFRFTRPFDVLGYVQVLPDDPAFQAVPHYRNTGITITTEMDDDSLALLGAEDDKDRVSYIAYGLVDTESMDLWRLLFYEAAILRYRQQHRQAIVEYATSFEAFLSDYLRRRLEAKYDSTMATYIVDIVHIGVKGRFRQTLEVVTGRKYDKQNDKEYSSIYGQWQSKVEDRRNILVHGKRLSLKENETIEGMSLEAHRTTYKTIRWIQDLKT
jgi:hypothetical protein